MKRIVALLLTLVLAVPAWADRPEEKRLEEARLLKELLDKDSTTGDARAEAMMRLANLYGEHAANRDDEAEKREWYDKAIRLYGDVLDDYRAFGGRAQALYKMGIALEAVDREDEGMKRLDEVVKQYPDSRWVPFAYQAMGEHYYDRRNLYKAITSYRRALDWPDAPFHANTRFKLGWSYYNARDYDDAIEQMKMVLDLSTDVGADDALKAKTMEALARFYADAGMYDEGYAFFRDAGDRANLKAMLERMGALAERSGDSAQVKHIKKVLEKEFPGG